MIIRVGLAVLAICAAWYWLARVRTLPQPKRKRLILQSLLWTLAAVVLGLVLTGRAHWLMAPFAILLPLFNRLTRVLRYVPILRSIASMFSAANASERGASGKQRSGGAPMSREQAAQILGVDVNASRDEIIAAHKRLMQKLHPDRGGSDALAAQINDARRVLLGD